MWLGEVSLGETDLQATARRNGEGEEGLGSPRVVVMFDMFNARSDGIVNKHLSMNSMFTLSNASSGYGVENPPTWIMHVP